MGEVIKILKKSSKDSDFEIELNKANGIGQPRMIHIQSKNGRVQFTERDFLILCCTYLNATESFKFLKKINE